VCRELDGGYQSGVDAVQQALRVVRTIAVRALPYLRRAETDGLRRAAAFPTDIEIAVADAKCSMHYGGGPKDELSDLQERLNDIADAIQRMRVKNTVKLSRVARLHGGSSTRFRIFLRWLLRNTQGPKEP
jgi:hypothetical protein